MRRRCTQAKKNLICDVHKIFFIEYRPKIRKNKVESGIKTYLIIASKKFGCQMAQIQHAFCAMSLNFSLKLVNFHFFMRENTTSDQCCENRREHTPETMNIVISHILYII